MTRRIACGAGSGGIDWQQRADVVVIGTGVAGLAAALAAQRAGVRPVIVSKARDTATFYAQGGVAVVLPYTDDSIEAHVADTLAAGAATGAEVQRALDHAAATADIRRDHVALQILHDGSTVTGVLVRNADGLGVLHAPSVILATGGLGHLYSATTNPEGSTGDGIALALWAGVGVSDIEFIQFHPTMLFDRNAAGRRPLITEALRGEGAVLRDVRGDSVTSGVHPMGDLAPRDVVAAAIDTRLRDTGEECVYLDARGIENIEA
ncbi:MAG: FAD-binding protein, partial [Mycobacterium sp.]|nr:FAD-binding protein [Mycobacterium sp.]